MENNQNNIWSNIKTRVQNHEPDEFTNKDWAEMEALLNAEVKKPFYLNGQFLKRLSILLLIGGLSFWLWSLNMAPKEDLAEKSAPQLEVKKADSNLDKSVNTKIPKSIQETENQLTKNSVKVEKIDNETLNENEILNQNQNENLNQKVSVSNLLVDTETEQQKLPSDNSQLSVIHRAVTELPNESTQKRELINLTEVGSLPLNMLEKSPVFDFNEVEIYNGPNRLLFGKWHVGFLFGINNSITDYQNLRLSVMPHIGLFASKTLARKLEFQIEAHLKTVVNYNETQTFEEDVFSSIGKVGSTRLQYTYRGFTSLDVPLTIKYALGRRFGILAGGRFSLINAHEPAESTSSNGRYSGPSLQERVPKKGFWDQDFGLVFGAEYYLNTKWLIDVRYNQGFKDITPDNLYENTKTHLNTDFQISLHRFF